MKISISFKKRIFLTIALVFSIFVVISLSIEQFKEQSLKRNALIEQLEIYTNIIDKSLKMDTDRFMESDSVHLKNSLDWLPSKLRVSIIKFDGDVIFDNNIESSNLLSNHLQREEIKEANTDGKGFDIRTSQTNQHKYLYFAKKYSSFYIRVALPYDLQTTQILKPDNFFLIISLILLVVILFVVNYLSNRLSASINKLVDTVINSELDTIETINYKETELNQISSRLIEYLKEIQNSKRLIQLEKEKLLQHIQTSQEAICFFSQDHEVLLFNGLFVQYFNLFFDGSPISPQILINSDFVPGLKNFILADKPPTEFFENQVIAHGRYFSIRASVFSDNAYEIVINDITKQEKTKQLKQEMTGNISHELRTPITSIRGYLDTVLTQNLAEDKKKYFLEKAQKQTILLSELINDIGLLNKIEDNVSGFNLEAISLMELIQELAYEYSPQLQEHNDIIKCNIPHETIINGNKNLLSSIFKNLIENSLRYAGDGVEINISQYNEDQLFYYLSFCDTGVGIAEDKHLNRLFDRFYRVQEGRTRETGGSGLGLAIVKNAVAFHKGTIVAKKHHKGGLEFLIKIKK